MCLLFCLRVGTLLVMNKAGTTSTRDVLPITSFPLMSVLPLQVGAQLVMKLDIEKHVVSDQQATYEQEGGARWVGTWLCWVTDMLS